MSLKLINVICVCLAACALLLLWGCGAHGTPAPNASEVKDRNKAASPPTANENAPYGPPVTIGTLKEQAVAESSGIVASRHNPGLFWTHNDSGDGPYLYAFDRSGRGRGVWRVTDAKSRDWEDIAAGPGPEAGRSYLYVGDIGDNDLEREGVTVYRIIEPTVGADDAASSKGDPRPTEAAEAIRVRYPDGSHNAETLLVHPISGDLYIITKEVETAAYVYKLRAPFSASAINTLTRVGQVEVPSLFRGYITGGDISPDGRRVVLCDYLAAYEASVPAAAGGSLDSDFDSVWGQPVRAFSLGERKQGEAICYGADGASVLATSEGRPAPLIETRRLAR